MAGLNDVWVIRCFGILTALMLTLSFLFCMVNGPRNGYNYLLVINILITAFIGGLVTKWYNLGELAASKLWYVMALASVIIVQSIVYDVFAFHTPPSNSPTNGTNFT